MNLFAICCQKVWVRLRSASAGMPEVVLILEKRILDPALASLRLTVSVRVKCGSILSRRERMVKSFQLNYR